MTSRQRATCQRRGSAAMNWVGGARSRIRQQSEKKLQKEFFAKQKLRRNTALCHIDRDQSPEGTSSKQMSLDLLSLQIVQHASEASGKKEDAACRRPYRQNLDLSGTRAGNLAGNGPWRTQELSLPMSPIDQPSTLQLMESSLYDELPIDKKVNAPLLPNALKGHHCTGQPNLPPPRATSTVVRDPIHSRQVPPFSSPLAGGRADLSTSRLSTEAVLPRKRQLAVRHGSSSSVSKVPSLPRNGFVNHGEGSATRICSEQQQYPFKKLAPKQLLQAVAMGGSRGNAGRLNCAPPQLGPQQSLRQRRHKPAGEQQMAPPNVGLNQCDGDMPEICQRNMHNTSAEMVPDCAMRVPYPKTSSLSSFEKMMMAVKVEGPPGRSDLVHESTPITAVGSSGQANREKKEPSWFNFISHLEQPLAPSSRDQEQQGHPKQVPLDGAHYPHLMAGSSGGEHGTDADCVKRDIEDGMVVKPHRKQGKEQRDYCSALEELLELGEELNLSGEETTEDPICLPVLEVKKEPQVLDKRVRPVGRHEGFSTLHSIAGRERVNIHTRATHMQSKEASSVIGKDGDSPEDLHCYETMLAKGALSPPEAGSSPFVADSLSSLSFAGASDSNLLRTSRSELKLGNPLHQKMHGCKAPPSAKVHRLSQPPQLEDSQFERSVHTAHCATRHMARQNDTSKQPLCEPTDQKAPRTCTVSKGTQTERPNDGIDTALQMPECQKMSDKGRHESHATQTEVVQKNETAAQVDVAILRTTPPLPAAMVTTAATQTRCTDRVELNASEFSQLTANLEGWVARQEAHQMGQAGRDVFACCLKELRGRIEQAENGLVWLSILSKLSSVDDM